MARVVWLHRRILFVHSRARAGETSVRVLILHLEGAGVNSLQQWVSMVAETRTRLAGRGYNVLKDSESL